jgi:ATP-binding cassette subfamily C protein LapB
LSNPTIVLLDEPSSSLDKRSEDQLINNLKPFLEGKTVILNTHRNPLLAWVDRIIILEQGQVVADGPKDVVLTSLQMQQGT